MTHDVTLVRRDDVVRIRAVETTARDEWRAAIALRGELDIANADELRVELAQHLDAGRRVIRVDAAELEFLDSTALGVLVEASTECAAERGSLILTNVPAQVWRLISVVGVDRVLLVDTASGP